MILSVSHIADKALIATSSQSGCFPEPCSNPDFLNPSKGLD
ncbi:hypothetical protein F3D3_4696 [Fusibacter sp. 3D3]|nr:hypothetical protein F3D3_0810 [Fusibacter sp. 3D3]GAU76317.1 hypothetical protein F3D3_0914 [Fusibacter sp. 3D3]GAU76851.1 hypothetical protein F3D3_1449 [Fusibacter sp. 3D3]GAU78074.1 hypothetical protein F3D3_2703 [Fusibacter sp. 3D3]GAU78077.1 hypothetical protein F3D3_2709 [Fusibacter sp. 3D3]